jgi:hypothetical protein
MEAWTTRHQPWWVVAHATAVCTTSPHLDLPERCDDTARSYLAVVGEQVVEDPRPYTGVHRGICVLQE